MHYLKLQKTNLLTAFKQSYPRFLWLDQEYTILMLGFIHNLRLFSVIFIVWI